MQPHLPVTVLIRARVLLGQSPRWSRVRAVVLGVGLLVGLGVPGGAGVASAAPDNQQHTLTAPSGPRFKITHRVWPEKVGQADICLWQDDKLAAMSLTIDDNTQPDHDWWVEQGKANGWPFTWFVISARVTDKPSYFGTWADFARLLEEGHDVQSHSVTHFDPKLGFTTIDKEYAPSIEQIEENLPGHTVTTLAYPNGLNPNNANDAELAGQLFIAVRGVTGHINSANATNYNNTNSLSTVQFGTANWADLKNILDTDDKNYRGWYVTHYHNLKPEAKETLLQAMGWMKENEDDLWVGLFREVAMYGQQRDTATLETRSDDQGGFVLTITDQMDDTLFGYPLTVKLRVPADWAGATVTQGDTVTPVAVIEHDGGTFVLAPVVPDAGDAVVTPTPTPAPGS